MVPIRCINLSRMFSLGDGVRDVSLSVEVGALHSIVGPNGSGKSTLLRLLMGLLRPTGGAAFLYGRPSDDRSGRAFERVGSLVDFPAFYLELSALENLMYVARLRRRPVADVDRALRSVKLHRVRNQPVRQFSMGMKQRLGLASALLGEPQLVILDEPTSSIDPVGAEEIEEIILEYRARHGATILFTSHSLDQVERLATHVSIMIDGSVLGTVVTQDEATSSVSIELAASAEELAAILTAIGIPMSDPVPTRSGTRLRGLKLAENECRQLQAMCVAQGIRILDWRGDYPLWRRQLRERLMAPLVRGR